MKEIDNTPIESFDQDWGDPDGTGKKAKSLEQVQAFLKKHMNNGYKYISTATPSTTPVTITGSEKVFYIATEKGDYTNYGLGTISELSVIKNESGSWKVEGLGVSFKLVKYIVDSLFTINTNLSEVPNYVLGLSETGNTIYLTGAKILRHYLKAGTYYIIGSLSCDFNFAVYGLFSTNSITGYCTELGDIIQGSKFFFKEINIEQGTYLHLSATPNSDIAVYKVKENPKSIKDLGSYENIVEALSNNDVSNDVSVVNFNNGERLQYYKRRGLGNSIDAWELLENKSITPVEVIADKYINTSGIAISGGPTVGIKKYNYDDDYDYLLEAVKIGSAGALVAFYDETHDINDGSGFIGTAYIDAPSDTFVSLRLSDLSKTSADVSGAKYIYISSRNNNSQLYISEIKSKDDELLTPFIINNPLPYKSTDEELSILYIGSSWMQDNCTLIGELCNNIGIKVRTANWYRGSVTFQQMLDEYWESASQSLIIKNSDLSKEVVNNCSVKNALQYDNWDIVVIANGAATSFNWDDYSHNGLEFVRKCKTLAPQATLATYQGWIFRYKREWQNSNFVFKKWFNNTNIDVLIPTGKAIYTLLTSGEAEDDVFRDQEHLSYALGHYTAACVNFLALVAPVFRINMRNNTLRSVTYNGITYSITEQQAIKAQNSALIACSDLWNYNDYSDI